MVQRETKIKRNHHLMFHHVKRVAAPETAQLLPPPSCGPRDELSKLAPLTEALKKSQIRNDKVEKIKQHSLETKP